MSRSIEKNQLALEGALRDVQLASLMASGESERKEGRERREGVRGGRGREEGGRQVSKCITKHRD